jgi:hypothetical protein
MSGSAMLSPEKMPTGEPHGVTGALPEGKEDASYGDWAQVLPEKPVRSLGGASSEDPEERGLTSSANRHDWNSHVAALTGPEKRASVWCRAGRSAYS